jgi:hypothetical protein
MKRFIFGFQRRVWCPKCTPLSSSWRIVTTAIVANSSVAPDEAGAGRFFAAGRAAVRA